MAQDGLAVFTRLIYLCTRTEILGSKVIKLFEYFMCELRGESSVAVAQANMYQFSIETLKT